MPTHPHRRALLALALAGSACDGTAMHTPLPGLTVGDPEDETGRAPDTDALRRLRDEVVAALRGQGIDATAGTPGRAALGLRLRLVQWAGPDMVPPALHDGALVVATLLDRGWRRARTAVVLHAARGDGPVPLAQAVAQAVARRLGDAPPPARTVADITATGRPVRHVGAARFAVGDDVVDLTAITHSHDPLEDPDVPAATDVTLPGLAPGGAVATITIYQVDPPLTGLPSRQPGIDRGIDFRDPANLVKSAYSNIVSIVRTEDPRPVPVASHPIGHFMVKVEVPGFPVLLTAMTTLQRGDAELVDLTIRRELGIGGILLTPQPGRLNAAAELARELALRQRILRVVDGLYFRQEGGRNRGPEYLIGTGNVVFARVRVPLRNGTDALACFAEMVARGEQNRFGSLLNRAFKGTGAGCAAFAMGWLQAAGVIPFITEPPPGPPPADPSALGPLEFWRASHSRIRIPWAHLGCDERVGAAQPQAARYTLYDLLLHGEQGAFVGAVSEGLAERLRERFGLVGSTLFEVGVQTPLRGLAVVLQRRDPLDRGDYAWGNQGVDVTF
jgi:hypothetical protein